MSSPWAFALTWFPFVESTVAAGDIGDGTAYPVTWDRTDGATTSDQMCQFEWTTKTVRRRADGSVVFTILNPNPPFDSATGTLSFSFDQSVTPVAGTDWSVLEPADLITGGRVFTFTDDTTTGVIVTAWAGPVTVTITFVGGDDVSSLLAVDGSSFTQYVKTFTNQIKATATGAGSHFASTNPASIGGGATSTGFSATLFHGTGTVYQLVPLSTPTDAFNFTRFSYEVTDNFTPPANI